METDFKSYIEGLVRDVVKAGGTIAISERDGFIKLIFKNPFTIHLHAHGGGTPVEEITSINEDFIHIQLANKSMAVPLKLLAVELWT